MNNESLTLGIDFGTEGVRAGLFDMQGDPFAMQTRNYATRWPHSGWAEQDPLEWWQALTQCVNELIEAAGVAADHIVGIGLDTTACTVVVLDEKMRPLRPAILWMDVRASKQAEFIANSGHSALKYNGFGPVSAEWMPCKALWVKENEPETYAASSHICDCVDYLTYKLTGDFVGSLNVATTRWYYNDREAGFPAGFYEQIGLPDILEKFPQTYRALGEPAGELCSDAASELGLCAGTPVAAGGADAFVAMLGLGAATAGRLALITGSSHLQLALSEAPHHTRGLWGGFPDAVVPGLHMVEGGQTATGSIVQWFRDTLIASGMHDQAASYADLNSRAASLHPGSNGLMVLDFWQGNRTPHVDPYARGMIWGLSLAHEAHHVYRAILEGICYGTEDVLQTMREAGLSVREVFVAGGPTHSDLWMQMHADVSNIPINLTRVADAPALGAAIVASVVAGHFDSLQQASEAMVHVERRIEPDPETHAQYQFYFEKYRETYSRMRDLMADMTRHEDNL